MTTRPLATAALSFLALADASRCDLGLKQGISEYKEKSMNFRTICIAIIVALIAVLAAFNWALSTPATVSLGLTEIQAPLGVLMLALTILLSVFFIAYVLWMQGSVLLEARRHARRCRPSAIWPTRPRLRVSPSCAACSKHCMPGTRKR
jgi:uncharacterized integral membrane protein